MPAEPTQPNSPNSGASCTNAPLILMAGDFKTSLRPTFALPGEEDEWERASGDPRQNPIANKENFSAWEEPKDLKDSATHWWDLSERDKAETGTLARQVLTGNPAAIQHLHA